MYGIDDAVDVVIGEKNIAIINRDGTVYITGSNETEQVFLETAKFGVQAVQITDTTEQYLFLYLIQM